MPDYVFVKPLEAFDWKVVVYFFLGGLSAGAFLLSVGTGYWKKDFKPLARAGAIASPIVLAIGMLFLLVDLGMPLRAYRLQISFFPSSAVSVGSWLLFIFFVLSVVRVFFLVKGNEAKAKTFAYLGVPFAVAVGTYTGIILTQAPGKALWNSALIPILFLNGALISGTALTMFLSVGKQPKALLEGLGKFAAALIGVELFLIVVELIILFNGGAAEVDAARALLSGQYSGLFLGVEIVLGAVIPVLALLLVRGNAVAQAIASVLILIGIYAMRHIIVIGGQVLSEAAKVVGG